MQKLKLFFVSAALLLTTAGVFAGRSKFAISAIYARVGTTWKQLDNCTSLVSLTETASGTQVKIINSSTPAVSYFLYDYNAGTYNPLYASGF